MRQWLLKASPTRAASFDNLVCPGKYCRRNCEAQCLSGLEIDDKFVLGRRLHRHVGSPRGFGQGIVAVECRAVKGCPTSALPPKSDISSTPSDHRYMPIAD